MDDILQMASSSQNRGGRSRGRGNFPRGRGFCGRIPYVDNEVFTMVANKNKRGGNIESSSSSSQKAKQKEDISSKETLANIVAKDDNSDYVSKNFTPHICYIEQEDFHLLDDPYVCKIYIKENIINNRNRISINNYLDDSIYEIKYDYTQFFNE